MSTSSSSRINHPIGWAMETDHDPSLVIADWLVKDVLNVNATATTVLTSRSTSKDDFMKLKTVFKHLRIEGETTVDRRLGAKLYATTIAGGLVFHQQLISQQAPARIMQAFIDLENDDQMPDAIRSLAMKAIELMPEYS